MRGIMADYFWLNRTLCDVLEDMRRCYKIRNFSPMLALIEEAQMMGNSMEAAIGDKDSTRELREQYGVMRKKHKRLKRKLKVLEAKIEEAEAELSDGGVAESG
jgi:hypothetical protein